MNQPHQTTPQKDLSAICGLFCPSCTVYIGTQEDRPRLEMLAGLFNCSVEDLECEGCRSEKRSLFCRDKCKMAKCATDRGLDFCGQCEEYPCRELKEFQAALPHRIELWKSHERIKEAGFEKWYEEMLEHFTCSECNTINSTYDISCRKCGATPSCNYVRIHREQIEEMQIKMQMKLNP